MCSFTGKPAGTDLQCLIAQKRRDCHVFLLFLLHLLLVIVTGRSLDLIQNLWLFLCPITTFINEAIAFFLVITVNYEHHLAFLYTTGCIYLRTITYWSTLLEINFGIFSQTDVLYKGTWFFSPVKSLIVELLSYEHLLRNQNPVYPGNIMRD